ncbi:MAG: N-formylglutamate amidohydrolase [Pseudomonadota bacterium]
MPYAPYHIIGQDRPSRWLITCDHATNRVPPDIGTLGLPAEDMARHIAYDIGALGVSLALGELLNAPVVHSDFSRLVIDPNRGEDDPTLIMQLYDGTIIPGNRAVNAAERERRLNAYYRPYDAALAQMTARRDDTIIVSIHSFTPQLNGRPKRPWEVGVLFAHDDRLSRALIAELARDESLTVGINEPYAGHLPGDAVDRHALRQGRHNTLIELRQDLIGDAKGQKHWADVLQDTLQAALEEIAPS